MNFIINRKYYAVIIFYLYIYYNDFLEHNIGSSYNDNIISNQNKNLLNAWYFRSLVTIPYVLSIPNV